MHEEYFIDGEEDIRERERAEEVRRLVRAEIRRVNSGEAESDMAEDLRREEAAKPKPRQQWLRWLGRSLTGEILISNKVQRLYNIFTVMAILFFFAIFVMFASFHREMQYAALQKEVALLRERAIRSTERRHRESSHSEILRRLQRAGLDLEDPQNQPKILQ